MSARIFPWLVFLLFMFAKSAINLIQAYGPMDMPESWKHCINEQRTQKNIRRFHCFAVILLYSVANLVHTLLFRYTKILYLHSNGKEINESK